MAAVIFDLDGTLVDSRIDFARMKRATIEELISCGVDRSVLAEDMTISENIRQGKRYLWGRLDPLNINEMEGRVNDKLTETEMESVSTVAAFPGVDEALRRIGELDIPMAILTRGSRRYTMRVLEVSGLDGRIGPCVCRDDHAIDEAKPNPLALDRAAAQLGKRPGDCLYIGDHPMDLKCARAAGAMFIGVLTGSMDEAGWHRHGCDQVLVSVADLPVALGLSAHGRDDS